MVALTRPFQNGDTSVAMQNEGHMQDLDELVTLDSIGWKEPPLQFPSPQFSRPMDNTSVVKPLNLIDAKIILLTRNGSVLGERLIQLSMRAGQGFLVDAIQIPVDSSGHMERAAIYVFALDTTIALNGIDQQALIKGSTVTMKFAGPVISVNR